VVSPASAQTTITGTIKDASGTALASGTIIFTLSQEGIVTDPALLITPPVQCTITNGVIGTCSLRGNDEISPAGTFYRVRIISSGGRTFLPERRYTITGATWDIGTATPLASDTIAAQAYQIIQDEGTNLPQRQKLNFTGAGVSCVDNSGNARTDCTFSGGGGGADQTVREVDGAPAVVAAIEEFDQADGFVVTQPVSGTARVDLANVPDSVLAQITTASKVSGAALSLLGSVPAGAGDLPLANLTDGTGFLKGAGGAGTAAYAAIADGDLPASIARDSELHAQSHVLAGSDHTASGLTTGNVLRAAGASTFAWQAIQPGDLGAAYLDALGDLAAGLCSTGEILEDQGGSWACIATPASGGAHNVLSTTHTDAVTASVVLGDLLYGDATPNWNRLAGNTSTTKQFLTQTGNGSVSAAPAWSTIAAGDLPNHDVTCASNPCVDDAEIVAAIARDSEITLPNLGGGAAGANTYDFGGATALEVPNATTLPGTCTVGQVYHDTDAAVGARFFLCTALNTWTAFDNPFGSAVDIGELSFDPIEEAEFDTIAELNTQIADATIEVQANKNAVSGYAGLDGSSRIAKAQGHSATVYNDQANTYGAFKQDFSAATVEIPNAATLPGTCAVGEFFMDNNETPAGQQVYVCSAANTWSKVGDGGGGGGDTTKTHYIELDCSTPQSSANAGNSFWTVTGLTDWDAGHWEFVKDVDGKIYCTTTIPNTVAGTPAAAIVLAIAANATSGVTRLSVATNPPADGESLNPASLTNETAQDITVPATARLRKDVTFTLTNAPAALDLLIVEIFHEGAHANDTLAINTEVYKAWLKIDLTQ
jgi:hypothetical protein